MEYLIGDFSKISRLGIKTLRYYHEISLLHPSRVDPFTGYRYYDETCLAQARAIQRLKELNFSLAEIREILAAAPAQQTLLQTMQQKLADIEQQITTLEGVRERLAAFVRSEAAPLIRPGAVEEVDLPDLLIASIHFVGRYSDLGQKIPQLLAACGDAGCGSPFSLYTDDHPMEDGADIQICLPVSRAVEAGDVHTSWLAGGHALSILHPGYYDQIWVSYQAVVDYWNQHHLEPIFPSREVYLQGGNGKPESVQHYLTQICFLVKPR